jgi:hypothetical protein
MCAPMAKRRHRPWSEGVRNGEVTCKRDSVSEPVARTPGDHPSVRPTRGCPNRSPNGRAVHVLCSALLRVGFTEPTTSPSSLVRSYRTVSPSPVTDPPKRAGPSAVSLCCTDPSGRPDLALASTLPCGVPTFLDAAARSTAVTRPPHHCADECTDWCSRGIAARRSLEPGADAADPIDRHANHHGGR